MNAQAPLRFAVLLEGVQLNQWQAECVSWLVASGAARLELIIKAAPRKERPLRRALSLLRYALWRAHLFSLGRRMAIGPSDPKLFHDVEVFACEARGRSGVLELGDLETEQIRSRRFDFILCFSESTPADGPATVAAQGIWCFRYGDALDPSGPLAAFRAAVLRRDNVVRVGLVCFIGGRAGDGRLLRDGYFAVPDYSFKKTLAGIMSGSVDFPVLACRDLLAGREFGKTLGDSPSARYTAGMPGNAVMFKFFIGMYARKPVALFRT